MLHPTLEAATQTRQKDQQVPRVRDLEHEEGRLWNHAENGDIPVVIEDAMSVLIEYWEVWFAPQGGLDVQEEERRSESFLLVPQHPKNLKCSVGQNH